MSKQGKTSNISLPYVFIAGTFFFCSGAAAAVVGLSLINNPAVNEVTKPKAVQEQTMNFNRLPDLVTYKKNAEFLYAFTAPGNPDMQCLLPTSGGVFCYPKKPQAIPAVSGAKPEQ